MILIGFALLTTVYFVVMSGTAQVHGTVRVETRLVSWTDNPPGLEDAEMLSANGYCMKGQAAQTPMLLSTKNRYGTEKLKYSFTAMEGMPHQIVLYIQLDHLTGAVGQSMELHFLTDKIEKGDLKRNFAISFELVQGVDGIRITVAGTGYDKPKVFQYPLSEIPDVIEI
jgi:hypothetical protein